MFTEAAQKKEPDALFYLAYFKLKEAAKQENDNLYIESNDMLRMVLAEDPKHSDALYYLGFLYENGLGTDKDLKTCQNYYSKAVEVSDEKNGKAMYKLANMIYSGDATGIINKGDILSLSNY